MDAFERQLLKRNAPHAFKGILHERQIKNTILGGLMEDQRRPKWRMFAAVAASLALLVGLGIGLFSGGNAPGGDPDMEYMVVSNPGSAPKTHLLEDGSTVILNGHGQISFQKGLKGNIRKVTLKGEAYFQVARDRDRPFIVISDDIQVKVLGTEFNVRQGKASIDVTVASGKVQVYDDNESVDLLSNEMAAFDRSSGTIKKSNVNPQLTALWKKQQVELWEIGLAEFSRALEQTHGHGLDFDGQDLSSYVLTIDYGKGEPIERIIEKVNYIYMNELTLIKTNETRIMVKKKN